MPKILLYAITSSTFFSKDSDMEVEFLKDPKTSISKEILISTGKKKFSGKAVQ